MSEKTLSVEEVLALLKAGPGRLARLTAGLTEAQLHQAPAPDEWSANEVLAHLRACADMWGGSIETILREDKPTLRAINPRTWIKQTDYLELEFHPSLRAFARQRAKLLRMLQPLTSRDWSRTATVTGAGKALQRDVLVYARSRRTCSYNRCTTSDVDDPSRCNGHRLVLEDKTSSTRRIKSARFPLAKRWTP